MALKSRIYLTTHRSEATQVDFGSGSDWLTPSNPPSLHQPTQTNIDLDYLHQAQATCPFDGYGVPAFAENGLTGGDDWYPFSNDFSTMIPEGLLREQA
jgi:hypothetical protein